MGGLMLGLGIAGVGLGVAGSMFAERRKFYRRNGAGVEEFDTYGSAVKAQFIEGSMKVVSVAVGIAGFIAAFFGVMVIF